MASIYTHREPDRLLEVFDRNTDISVRSAHERRITQLYSFAAALSEAGTPDDVVKVAVEQGTAALGATAGSLTLLSVDGLRMEMAGSIGYPPHIIDPWKSFPLDAPVPIAEAVRTRQAIYMQSAEERLERYPELIKVAAKQVTQSSASLPLITGGKAIGCLGLSFNRPGAFSEDDKEFMFALARQCAQALERARLFEAERQARADAERANRSKDEFLAMLSHELRTPLTPVMLTVSMLESNPLLPATLREDVASIRRNVELESRLISDLLDLTRITKGKLQLDEQDVDLHLVIRSAIEICQREASARLIVDLRSPRHVVRGDSTRLQQIFWNLINNAQKFTPPLGIITVRSEVSPDGNRIRVQVADNGAGVDPALLPKLFDAFEQGDVRLAKQQAGLGLGLAISKRLVEAHDGVITAHSPGRGGGSTFTVDLPVVVDAIVPSTPPTRHAERLKAHLNILLVEDHAPSLRALSRLLMQMGHRVTPATSVASALAAAGLSQFDLLISDLGLPDGSGLDVMRRLREPFKDRAIALTGYGMESDIAASRDAGFVEHLIKPVDVEQLNDAIARVVQTELRTM